MRMLMSLGVAAALVLAPATGLAQDEPKPEKAKPGFLETVGGAVGGIVASSAGTAAGGPLGGAAAGMAGKKVGNGVGGFVGKIFKRKKAEPPMEVAEAPPPPPGHIASAPLDVPPVEAPADLPIGTPD
ncbi:hypothetical protein [Phenylobacterium sp.]|uniref:hypothetical protein n=1 Tax=Phenylobacterium sp. TaxID=1871053 RepID=UPI0027367768|nr:hypothetical protein [Phenylobacterium sp.]MDP3852929.1 hypothetical protein [Phenylobacterium sp.]